jgi:dolichol-phosphate mannosyltransferase
MTEDRVAPVVTFIVPALNEEGNLEPLVERLLKFDNAHRPCEIVIIDDASCDGTFEEGAQIARRDSRVRIVHKEDPRGLGRAIRRGLQEAVGRAAVVVMADGVDPLETAVPLFCKKVLEEDCQLVLLSRYTTASDADSIPFTYKFFQFGYRFFTKYVLGISFPDTTYAFRAVDVEFARSLGLTSEGFEISPELTFKVVFAGGRVGEVAGSQTRRVRGKSKFRFLKGMRGYSRVLFEAMTLRVRGLLRQPKSEHRIA